MYDKGHVLSDEFHDALVVLGLRIADAATLHDVECRQRYLDRFDALPADGRRKNKRIGTFVVGIAEHAVVHGLSLLVELPHALQYADGDFLVRKRQPEESGLLLPIGRFVFTDATLLLFEAFALDTLLPFVHPAVVLGLQVGRTNVFRIVQVFSEVPQFVEVVAPQRTVGNDITVACCDFDGRPIGVYPVVTMEREMLQEGNLSDFEQRFQPIAGKQSMNQPERG